MKIDHILRKARQSISSFCYEECNAFCCRKCYLILKPSQVDEVTQGRKTEMMKDGLLTEMKDGRYSMYMGAADLPCPSLKENKCSIHTSRKRPKTCRDFPIFVKDDMVLLSPRCLAVRMGLLYPYVKRLMMLGYRVIKAEDFSEYEFYKMDFSNNPPDPSPDRAKT